MPPQDARLTNAASGAPRVAPRPLPRRSAASPHRRETPPHGAPPPEPRAPGRHTLAHEHQTRVKMIVCIHESLSGPRS
eukprot:2978593-Pleurochrysis_carterae.AAC.1